MARVHAFLLDPDSFLLSIRALWELPLDGEFMMTVDGRARGAVAVIGSDVAHSVRAVTNCRFFDVFHPVREDYT